MIKSILDKEGKELKSENRKKKPVVVFTVADKNNISYAVSLLNSLRKFHDWPVILYTDEIDQEKLPNITNMTIVDLGPYLQDRMFFYRQKPLLSEPLLDEYELVIGLDSDQLILGDLSYILETTDYDVGTVINWNRYDEKIYPAVQGWGIFPAEYFNCGLVALRSKKFAHHWNILCHTAQFDRMQFKEQDLLNALCYFGNYNVRCFDHPDPVKNVTAFWGLIGKGEWNRAILEGNKIVVPKGFGDTPFPPADMEIKVAHMGGGAGTKKDNWGAFFTPEVLTRINSLIK